MIDVSAESTCDILVPVSATSAGVAVDPTGDTVEMAFVASGSPAEADWNAGTWESDGDTDYAKCLIGPDGGAVTLTARTVYAVWVRVSDNPETVVARVGFVRAY